MVWDLISSLFRFLLVFLEINLHIKNTSRNVFAVVFSVAILSSMANSEKNNPEMTRKPPLPPTIMELEDCQKGRTLFFVDPHTQIQIQPVLFLCWKSWKLLQHTPPPQKKNYKFLEGEIPFLQSWKWKMSPSNISFLSIRWFSTSMIMGERVSESFSTTVALWTAAEDSCCLKLRGNGPLNPVKPRPFTTQLLVAKCRKIGRTVLLKDFTTLVDSMGVSGRSSSGSSIGISALSWWDGMVIY